MGFDCWRLLRCCCCLGKRDQDTIKRRTKPKPRAGQSGLVTTLLLLIILRLLFLVTDNSSDAERFPRQLPCSQAAPFKPRLAAQDQERQLDNDESAIDRFNSAVETLRNGTIRSLVDPLSILSTRNRTARVPFHPTVKYLGILVDAGRHYFPIEWLKEFIRYLHQLRFNLLHLRLTDDQAFNLQLVSHPELAYPSASSRTATNNNTGKVYTPTELRDLTAFAKELGISIVPEINVPGHAGAWAGIPGMIIPCPKFICNKGYGIPLNTEHPQMQPILKDILVEVLDIFDNPPFLHLGGDEVSMGQECFREAGIEPFQYDAFERMLQSILADIGYPEDQVIRWEETPQLTGNFDPFKPRPSFRAGAIEHYWHDTPGIRTGPGGAILEESVPPRHPFFVSRKLYMDTNNDDGALDIVLSVFNNLQLDKGPSYFPTAVVAGAFELDIDMWRQRNVAGRLIAVAMGASQVLDLKKKTTRKIMQYYYHTCHDILGLDSTICDLHGLTATPLMKYRSNWQKWKIHWEKDICERLTGQNTRSNLKPLKHRRRLALQNGNKYMWKTMSTPLFNYTHKLALNNHAHHDDRISTRTGVILDLVNGMQSVNQTQVLIKKFLAPLKISLLQLRLADNNAFALELEHVPSIGFSLVMNETIPLPKSSDLAELVDLSHSLGIKAYPEISLSTNAGGWVYSGYLVNCPETFCNVGQDGGLGVASIDVRRADYLPVVYSTIRELLEIFFKNGTIGVTDAAPYYLHLGSDERRANEKCFAEEKDSESGSGLSALGEFEKQLTMIVQDMLGFPTQNIVRWENSERTHYKGRTGETTHYPSTDPFQLPQIRPNESFFVTIDILAQPSILEVYQNTLALIKLKPMAVFAELRRLDAYAWLEFQVEMRLAAFHMATSPLEEKDFHKNEKHFLDLVSQNCTRFGFDNCQPKQIKLEQMDRSLLSISPNTSKPFYFMDSEVARTEVCDIFVDSLVIREIKSQYT